MADEKIEVSLDQKSLDTVSKIVKDEVAEATKSIRVLPNAAEEDKSGRMGFKSVGEMIHAFRKVKSTGVSDVRVKAVTDFGGSYTAGDGGSWVPQIFVDELFAHPALGGTLMQKCRKIVYTGSGNVLTMPVDENSADWATSGPIIETRTEGQAMTERKPTAVQRTVSLTKYSELVHLSDEFSSDVFGDLTRYIVERGVSKIAYAVDKAILTAVTGSAATIGVNRYSNQANIYFIDVLNVWTRVAPMYRQNATWLVSPLGEAELLQASFDPSSTVQIPVFLTQNYLGNEPGTRLLGKPMLVHNAVANVGTAGDLIAADLNQVVVFTKSESPTIASSMHFAFDQDLNSLRLTFRAGAATWSAAPIVEAVSGAGTTSATVKLV